jgi:hypothetical protein
MQHIDYAVGDYTGIKKEETCVLIFLKEQFQRIIVRNVY